MHNTYVRSTADSEVVREVVLSPSHGQCPWERCNSAATQTCWGVAMCACEPTSLPVSSQKKAASDALTAGQIQSCFYRQRENPLTVAVLGIICSPWVMWTTRWKKKKKKKMEAHKGKEKRRQYNHCFPLCAMSILNNSVTKRLWSNNLYQSGKEMSYNKWCPETPLFHDPNSFVWVSLGQWWQPEVTAACDTLFLSPLNSWKYGYSWETFIVSCFSS